MRKAGIARALSGLVGIALLVGAIPAGATEATRESFTQAAEPICEANTQANERILEGVRSQVQQGKLAPAALKFEKAAKALKATQAQLATLPQPPADRAKLAKWLAYVKAEADYFKAAALELKGGDKAGAAAMVVRLTHTASLANSQATGFEFDYCRFEPSRFT
jgi:hypothetical protein